MSIHCILYDSIIYILFFGRVDSPNYKLSMKHRVLHMRSPLKTWQKFLHYKKITITFQCPPLSLLLHLGYRKSIHVVAHGVCCFMRVIQILYLLITSVACVHYYPHGYQSFVNVAQDIYRWIALRDKMIYLHRKPVKLYTGSYSC